MKYTFTVHERDDKKPAYEILHSLGMSGLLVKRIRIYGQLLANGEKRRMKDLLNTGDKVEAIYLDDHKTFSLRPDHNIRIFFEDSWLLVCEKPAGLVTHPSWQHMDDSLIQRLSEHRLHPVMRLDRETSGLIVIAKNGFAHDLTSRLPMEKEYIAFVYGAFDPLEGSIDAPIGRSESSIMLREVRNNGKRAVTHYRTEEFNKEKGISRVRFILETGRCHQIRVHSLYKGHPLVSDGLYGVRSVEYPAPDTPGIHLEDILQRQALHAAVLSFIHPVTRKKMYFESPLPEDMKALL